MFTQKQPHLFNCPPQLLYSERILAWILSFVLIQMQDRNTAHWQQRLIMVRLSGNSCLIAKLPVMAAVQLALPPRTAWHYSSGHSPTYVCPHNTTETISHTHAKLLICLYFLFVLGWVFLVSAARPNNYFFNLHYTRRKMVLCITLGRLAKFFVWTLKILKSNCWTYCHGSPF